ncbi:MAG TPA: carboxypeptidase regulatory-like domain-containing protein [Longimicrobiales bacterium]|nr:carboxypeptidase regulatory-like domain-containing protein [Longimicrobiales bacterium]
MLARSTSTLLFLVAVFGPPLAAAQSTERLYEEACDGGDMVACNVFGLMLETGEGVPRDLERAAELYQRACEGGELIGCTNVGLLFGAGVGLPADPARAAGFFQIACEGGEQLGCELHRRLEDASTPEPLERYEKAGRVGDADSGRPLAEAIVELPGVGVRAISGPDGRFLLASVPAGRHAVRAERLGYELLLGTLDVPGNPDFLMLMTPAEILDPRAPGQIVGRVVEGAGGGLSDVEIAVVDQERARTLSNQQGRFTIRDVQPGLVTVRFARLGYAPRTAVLVVQPGRTAEIAAAMPVEPIELEPVEVTVRSLDLERDGFYERAGRGWGHHFAPGDVERISPIDISDLFRGRVPGVRVVRLHDREWGYVTRLIGRRAASFTRGPCFLDVYVDGMLMMDRNVDLFSAETLAAAEVYYGPGTPMQYNMNGCGAVLLWTRRGN